MWSETRRPDVFEGIIGHTEIKSRLRSYLSGAPYDHAILLHGPPGIGKTTLALAAARSCGYEILEVNASRSMRSFGDAGTAPKVGDRLQFVFVAENKDKGKQGERIEEIGYVREKKLTPDTSFYITNQIQNPVAQLFALCIEKLDGYVPPRSPSYATLMEQMMEKHNGDEEEASLAVLARKEKQLESLLFLGSSGLSNIVRRNTRGPMDAFVRR